MFQEVYKTCRKRSSQPRPGDSFQSNTMRIRTKAIRYPKRMMVGSMMLPPPAAYGTPLSKSEAIIQGRPRPRRMLNTLEPSTLQTAMFPCPLRATRIDESASGTDVPAASTVRPIRNSGTSRMQPARAAKSTMRKERTPIHMMLIVKVPKYHLAHASLRQSGMVNSIEKASGHEMMVITVPRQVVSSSSSSGSGAGFTMYSSGSW
mmetsp:Transcript_6326/g.14599  ORF Transcript_6326/g.14599 Transcript_6326/m.14599 type:complete len:205 (-) Transcript_6326:794-1408(-)